MVQLTFEEQEWLGIHYPQLIYDKTQGVLLGVVDFNLQYQDKPIIKDKYLIRVDMSVMPNRFALPIVYNPDSRIKNIANRKQISTADLHLNKDESLCLILPVKLKEVYPNGFTIQDFMRHLCNHLYWVSYYERYEQEAWKAEEHGYNAFFEYLLDPNNASQILKNKKQLQYLRIIYKECFSKGITFNRLKKSIQTPSFITNLKYQFNELSITRRGEILLRTMCI